MADLFVRGNTGDSAAGATSVLISLDCTGCDLVIAAISYDPVDDSITSANYAGAAATMKDGETDAGGTQRIEVWQKIAPATGVNNFTFVVPALVHSVSGGAMGFNGTDQVTPLINVTKATGTTGNSSVTQSNIGASNSAFSAVGTTSTVGASNQNSVWANNNQTFDSGGDEAAGNGSVTFTRTLTGGGTWSAISFEVKAAAAGGGRVPPSPSPPSRRMVSWTRRAA